MPKASKFAKYFDNKDNPTNTSTPKVQINEATLTVMGQAAKDFGYTKEEFVEAVEMYKHFGNVNLRMSLLLAFRIDYPSSTTPTITTTM